MNTISGKYAARDSASSQAQRGSCGSWSLEQDGSSDIRVRALMFPETVYTQARISVHFKPEWVFIFDRHMHAD
ncbi:hypothetical protein [Aeromonas salmonicida]|uniref:hypothetical protein n=1 Tax=Aeromonas salmonicida TaxID=645 RepID=UPI003D00FFE2